MTTDTLRTHIVALLAGGQAFATPERILASIPPEARDVRPHGLEHSLRDLVEHLRIAQRDILEFCGLGEYSELKWPEDYWATPVPSERDRANDAALDDVWRASVEGFLGDLSEAKRLALDPAIDLFAIVPHGTTQTFLRELLVITDHNAHHLGQVIQLRKLIGVWPPAGA